MKNNEPTKYIDDNVFVGVAILVGVPFICFAVLVWLFDGGPKMYVISFIVALIWGINSAASCNRDKAQDKRRRDDDDDDDDDDHRGGRRGRTKTKRAAIAAGTLAAGYAIGKKLKV